MNYLIYGTSYKLVDIEIKKIVNSHKCQTYDLEEVSFEDVLIDLNYKSLFDEEKYVILKNISCILSSKKDDKNMIKLIDYLKEPNEETTLIIVSKEKPSSKGLQKEMLTYVKVIETSIFSKANELYKELGDVIRRDGYKINSNALNIFVEKCSINYDIAINEFEKLKSIKSESKVIDEKDILDYVSNYNLNDIFAFKDKVINKDLNVASQMIDELEYSKMELIPIVVMLAREYITLYDIKLLAQANNTNEMISKILNNMHPYRVQLLRTTSMKYTLESLEKIIMYLCDLDKRLISEDNLGFEELRKFLLIL